MKRSTKKGFTIVELVIVIAVIAILTAVLIPTFTSVTQKAKESNALQNAKNEFQLYLAEKADKLTGTEDFYIHVANSDNGGDGWWFEVQDLALVSKPIAKQTITSADLTKNEAEEYTAVASDSTECYVAADLKTKASTPLTEGTKYYKAVAKDLNADQNDSVAIYAK